MGQSIGALAGSIAGLAWWTVGPNAVAEAIPERRVELALDSLVTRGMSIVVLAIPAIVLDLLLVPNAKLVAVLFTIGTLLDVFTFGWYYAGTGQPRLLVRNEALVRVGVNIVAIPVMWATHMLGLYAWMLIGAGLGMLAMNMRTIFPPGSLRRIDWRRAMA